MRNILRRLRSRITGKSSPRFLRKEFPDSSIGEHSYGGLNVIRFGDDTSFSVGKYCSFAADVKLMLGGGHRHDWVTTYPFPEIMKDFAEIEGHPASKGDIMIGNDVWIGREAMIMSGVNIGDGAVVAARSVVTSDIPAYAIAAGQPARVIKPRFSEDIVERLLRLRWWDWPDERVRRAVPLMLQEDVLAFIEAAERGEL